MKIEDRQHRKLERRRSISRHGGWRVLIAGNLIRMNMMLVVVRVQRKIKGKGKGKGKIKLRAINVEKEHHHQIKSLKRKNILEKEKLK